MIEYTEYLGGFCCTLSVNGNIKDEGIVKRAECSIILLQELNMVARVSVIYYHASTNSFPAISKLWR